MHHRPRTKPDGGRRIVPIAPMIITPITGSHDNRPVARIGEPVVATRAANSTTKSSPAENDGRGRPHRFAPSQAHLGCRRHGPVREVSRLRRRPYRHWSARHHRLGRQRDGRIERVGQRPPRRGHPVGRRTPCRRNGPRSSGSSARTMSCAWTTTSLRSAEDLEHAARVLVASTATTPTSPGSRTPRRPRDQRLVRRPGVRRVDQPSGLRRTTSSRPGEVSRLLPRRGPLS